MRALVFAVLLLLPHVVVAQQGVVVRGRVTAAETGMPLRNATVSAIPPIGRRAIRTDAEGRFEIVVTESRLSLTITKAGYVRTSVNQPRVPGQLNVSLARAGALTVYVVDASGEPIPGASVWTMCSSGTGGRGGGDSSADDLGRRRISSLAPGECSVDAGPPPVPNVAPPVPVPGASGIPVQFAGPGGLNPAQRMAERERTAVKVAIRAGEEQTLTLQPSTRDSTVVGNSAGPTGTGAIRGRVLGKENRPLANAMVMASLATSRQAVITDQNGAYELSRLPAGQFTLQIRAPGFALRDDSAAVPGRPIALEAGQQAVANFSMVKGGVITGTIRDEYGEPAEGVIVTAQAAGTNTALANGLPFAPQGGSVISLATDDRGRYRIAGLPAGTYRVMARIGRGGSDDLLFYPGRSAASEAVPVTVALESETPGIDMAIEAAANALTGRIMLSTGAIPAGGVARLARRGEASAAAATRTASVGREGEFSFPDVPAGVYELSVTAAQTYAIVTKKSGKPVQAFPIPATEFSRTVVTVSGSSAPLAVVTSPGSRVRGQLVFDDERGDAVPSAFRLSAIDASEITAVVNRDWSFDLQDLSSPTRIGLAQVPPGWYLKSFVIGGVNAADDPVDFSRGAHSATDVRAVLGKTSTITGRVDSSSTGGAGVTVVAFPVERERRYAGSRYLRLSRAKEDGAFVIDVPPGQYWVVAISGTPATFPDVALQALEPLGTMVFAGDTGGRAELRVVRLPQ